MDPARPSLATSSGGTDPQRQEAAFLKRNGMDGERQRDADSRDSGIFDGSPAGVEINSPRRGSVDKHRFITMGYQRRTKQKVVTDFSTVSKGGSAAAKPRAALRQVLFSQSEKSPTNEDRGQLDLLKQDLGTYAVPADLRWAWKQENRGASLEKSWTDIVDSHSTMSKTQRHQQEALWEFVHTELAYINKLIVIKDLVIAALVNLQRNGFLLEVTPELLFSNLPAILAAHQLFWQQVIYPMLQEVRWTGMPFDPLRLEAGCLQFHQLFSSYKHYCWEEEHCLEFTRRQVESNPHFFTFVQWVETHPQCQRMRLGDMQAKPHQRITKYPLLLKAVLKSTQEPHAQHALRVMLSSVHSFLESINDYLKLKDEELALGISAQRVDGYEVEGINEEIDKHVRDTCRFDLECPIRGVGPGVVRKLLLEESLKIRGRKDNKLEVVALLFSDVLLMTKVHKKGERLKVVRPPLALDRTHCIALKDGCSFVLIEVGELHSAMNVYIFVASTSESCFTWVTTIQKAKDTLRSLRETETKRKMENYDRVEALPAKRPAEAPGDDTDTEEQGVERFVDKVNEEFLVPQSSNGFLAPRAEEEEPAHSASTVVSIFHSQPNSVNGSMLRQGSAGWRISRGLEWIEMGVRRQEIGIYTEEALHSGRAMEPSLAAWNHSLQSAPTRQRSSHTARTEQPERKNPPGEPAPFLDGYPAVDYPMNEDSDPQPFDQAAVSGRFSEEPVVEGGTSARRDSDTQSVVTRISQSSDSEASSEAWSFSKNLKSPGLRRRRPTSVPQGAPSRPSFRDSEPPRSASLSNSGSNYNTDTDTNSFSFSSQQSFNSQQLPRQASSQSNQEMSCDPQDEQFFSESELPDASLIDRRVGLKQLRSFSIPSNVTREHCRSMHSLPRGAETQSAGLSSRLDGPLNRAKVRVRERDGLRRDRQLKNAHRRTRCPPPSPSFSTTPSPSPSDVDREAEFVEEVALMRHKALTVSEGWKEQLVDEDDDDKRDSVVFSDGVNVDWPGWCFDDDEVMDHLHPADEGLLEGISRTLAFWDVQRAFEQEDGECSQV